MKERPILFTGEMVRAILEGRKTMTRRVVKPQPPAQYRVDRVAGDEALFFCNPDGLRDYYVTRKCPYGKVGDRLWVKETFCSKEDPYNADGNRDSTCVHFRADGYEVRAVDGDGFQRWNKDNSAASPWRTPLFMPRWASRLTLEITRIRVERLQDIGKDGRKAKDVLAEGIAQAQIDRWGQYLHPDDCPAHTYGVLWESINGKGSWDANPWVWVIEFRVVPTGVEK